MPKHTTKTLPSKANPMAQKRAFGKQGLAKRSPKSKGKNY